MTTHVRGIFIPLMLMLLPVIAMAQVGPMGIGNKDGTPTFAGPQPRLLLWLDGSSALPADYVQGQPLLTVWRDKSGNDHHFYPSSEGTVGLTVSPSFGPKGTFSNAPNRAAVQFFPTALYSSKSLVCENFEMPEDGFTIYFVIKTDDDHFGFFNYATPTEDHELLIYNNNGFKMRMGATQMNSHIGNISQNAWNYGGITWSNENSSNWQYKRNSQSEGSFGHFNGFTIDPGGKVIIGDIQNGPSSYPTGDDYTFSYNGATPAMSIAEIIVFEGRLNRAGTRLMRTYLWLKYGINGAGDAWDKFHGNMEQPGGNQWGGKYYTPIAVGRDNGNPNAGELNEARANGLVLRVRQDEWTQNRSYLVAGTYGENTVVGYPNTGLATNLVTDQGLGSIPDVIERWTRVWEISGWANEGSSQKYEVGFDFGEGIGGDIPQNPHNFELLWSNNPNGPFQIVPVAEDDKFVLDDELVFRVTKSQLTPHGRYYTIGTKDALSSLTGSVKRTWYSYQTGDWSDPLTWTMDGSSAPAYVNPNGDIPGIHDNIHIGAGRVVTLDMDPEDLNYDHLSVYGTLNLGSYQQLTFQNISGSGLIRCSAGNFPLGNSTAFADPVFGGTLEYYGSGPILQNSELTLNNLTVNLSNANATVTFAGNLTHNGLFEVKKGKAFINNPSNPETVFTVYSYGNVLVESQGTLGVADASNTTSHKWYFYKDLINNGGTIKFTNRMPYGNGNNFPHYSSDELKHHFHAYFSSNTENQEVRLNGPSYFSRIVVDKGGDMTYAVSFSSNNPNYFHLLGRCDYPMGNNQYYSATQNSNSFALINGTAEIRENIFIPLQTNNHASGRGGNYNINHTAQLWINGGTVEKSILGGSGNTSALVIYGIVKVTSGTLNVFAQMGITIRGNGIIQIDGGLVETNQIQTSNLGPTNIGGLIINNGVVNVNGDRPEGAREVYATLSMTYPGNIFHMSGGVLNVRGATNRGLVFINSDPQNTSVSGGVVNLDVSSHDKVYKIMSRAAFWDLTLMRSSTHATNRSFIVSGGTSGAGNEEGTEASMVAHDLIVRRNFKMTGPNNPTLQMDDGERVSDLYVHGDFTIGDGSIYEPANNTTHFVGISNTELNFGGSTAFPFHHVEVNKDIENRFVRIQQTTGANPVMDVHGNLSLEKGYFLTRRHVVLRGNLTNRTRFGDATTTGDLQMEGSAGRQDIISDGGAIHRLDIKNPDGVALLNDGLTITGLVRLSDGPFFIGNQKLRISSTFSSPLQSADPDKFIVCSGNPSAGGLEILNHKADQTLTFPIGVSTGTGLKYNYANVYINSAWSDSGYVRITPVDTLLTTVDLDGTEDYLNFYWKVSASEYENRPNITHRFRYQDEDLRGPGPESSLVAGRVLSTMPFTRETDDNSPLNTSSNFIFYNGNDVGPVLNGNGTPLVDADYTAGAADRFPVGSSPDIYFSRTTSASINSPTAWENGANWNKLSDCAGCTDPYDFHNTSKLAASDYPKTGDIAVIGFNVNHGDKRPHFYKAPPGGIEASQVVFTALQDESGNRLPRFEGSSTNDFGLLRPTLQIGSSMDIVKTGLISGEGALLLKNDIDLGVTDIGGFLAEDSSVVVIDYSTFVSNNANYLPAQVPNLFIAKSSVTITNNIRVRGNLEVAGNAELVLGEGTAGNIEVDGDLILNKYQISSGHPKVIFNGAGESKTIHVRGDLKLLGGGRAEISIGESGPPPPEPIPWTPDAIEPLLWLDATENVVTDGNGKVSSWTSRVNGYVASETDPDRMPSYATGINGVPTLQFDGSNDRLLIPHDELFNIHVGQDFEIFSVSQSNNPTGNQGEYSSAIYAKGQVGARDFQLDNAGNKYRLYINQASMNIVSPSNIVTHPNFGWVRRQGNEAHLFNSRGGSQSAAAGSATMITNTKDVSIASAAEGTARFMSGQIGEILFVRRSLSGDERKRMEGYLAHKWGFESFLPPGHPYKDDIPYEGEQDEVTHPQLIVEGNIIQHLGSHSTNGLGLYNTAGYDTTFVNLVLSNTGNHEFINNGGPKPRLWRLTVDKGLNTNSSFTFNSDIDIIGPSDREEKPITIRNGLLKFNHPNIDINLASGGGDFRIPATGGLELNAGQLHINGFETGMLLVGSLKITGGALNIGDTEGMNNYIEYGATQMPKLEITGGSLTVGSQIRRGLSSIEGSLNYIQSGGTVVVGRYSAPQSNRAMLEVLNDGRFEHTGGTLTFVRGVNQSSRPSLRITPDDPDDYEVGSGSQIFIGNEHSPSGSHIRNFGIQSAVPLHDLYINSLHGPRVHLITNNLELTGDLTISSGARLTGGDREIILHGDVLNNGMMILNAPTGILRLVHPVSGTVSGSGTFDLFDLYREGSGGETLVQTDLLVEGDFKHDLGELDFEGNTLTVKGNATIAGNIRFDAGSHGLIFSGSEQQVLTRSEGGGIPGSTEIDIMTINNIGGVGIPPGYAEFKIGKELRLQHGVFALEGNLLEMKTGSKFTSVTPFGEKNMIVTGGNYTNFGILLNLPANTTDDIFVPLGIERYLPVNLDFSQPDYSSGTTPSSYLLRLNADVNGVVTAPADMANVLGMFLAIDGSNIGNDLKMDLNMNYHDQYVNYTLPNLETDYIPARVLADATTVQKFDASLVDTDKNIITFHLSGDYAGSGGETAVDGDYFAGIDEAIPNNILHFSTITTGPVNTPIYDSPVPGGGAPSGAVVTISEGDNVFFTIEGVSFYRTEIEENASILINANNLHRLGTVTGKGTIHLQNTGQLPSGFYSGFFGCDGGKLMFQASGGESFEILSNLPEIKEVTLRGVGDMTIAGSNVNICDDLIVSAHIQSSNSLRISASNSGMLTVNGNMLVEKGTFDFRQGNATIEGDLILSGTATDGGRVLADNDGTLTVKGDLEIGGRGMSLGTTFRETNVKGNVTKTTNPAAGSIQEGTGGAKLLLDNELMSQTISGDFTGVHGIPTLELNNPHGLEIDGGLDISETLLLTDGIIHTDASNMLKLTADNTVVEPLGGQTNAYVNGPMQWTLSNTASDRIFPVGKNDRFRPLTVSEISAARTWEVEYVDTSARIVPVIEEMTANPSYVPAVEVVSIQEFWRVETDGGTTEARIGLSWGDSSSVSTTTADQDKLVVLAYNESDDWWDSFGMQQGSRTYNSTTNRGNFKSDSKVSFSTRYLTIGSTDGMVNPLPVTWLYFEGENIGDDHVLYWATASERNNDYFELERSFDGRSWEVIGRETAVGMSNTQTNYSFTDHNAPFGWVYYRLVQVDFDGKMEYAPNVVSLEKKLPKDEFDILLYPNPTRLGKVQFRMSNSVDANVKVSISDLSGKVLLKRHVQVDGQGTSAPVGFDLQPGIYLVTVIANDKMISKPLVVTR